VKSVQRLTVDGMLEFNHTSYFEIFEAAGNNWSKFDGRRNALNQYEGACRGHNKYAHSEINHIHAT
jgi:hypothetical protein